MTERITSAQSRQFAKLVLDVLASHSLTKGGAQRVLGSKEFQSGFKRLLFALACEYFLLLTDEEAHEWLRKYARKSSGVAAQIVNGYRRGAQEEQVPDSVPCHMLVNPGARMKHDIPKVGPCVQDFSYLMDWTFQDPPTEECLFSLIPALLRDSTRKSVDEQRKLLEQVRLRLKLPESHLTGFGPVTHIAGAALVHKAAGRDIFAGKIARTDTCGSGGGRLDLSWDEGRLFCGRWRWDGGRAGPVGVLACGVEKALGR